MAFLRPIMKAGRRLRAKSGVWSMRNFTWTVVRWWLNVHIGLAIHPDILEIDLGLFWSNSSGTKISMWMRATQKLSGKSIGNTVKHSSHESCQRTRRHSLHPTWQAYCPIPLLNSQELELETSSLVSWAILDWIQLHCLWLVGTFMISIFFLFQRVLLWLIWMSAASETASELNYLTTENTIHILAVSETHLDATVLDTEVSIDGYNMFRRDRNKHGGGIALYRQHCALISCQIV